MSNILSSTVFSTLFFQFNSLFPKAMRLIGEYINIFTIHDKGYENNSFIQTYHCMLQNFIKYGDVGVENYESMFDLADHMPHSSLVLFEPKSCVNLKTLGLL